MFFRLIFDFWVSCDFISAVFPPNSVGIPLGEEGSRFSLVAVRPLSLLNARLLLVRSGGAAADGGGTDVVRVNVESLKLDKDVREVVTRAEKKSDLLMVRGRGGTFSLRADDEMLTLETFVFSGPAKEPRFRRASSPFGLALVSAALELFESIAGLDSVLLVTPLSRLAPAN